MLIWTHLNSIWQVYTSAYDCTVRSLSFTSGISREVYSAEDMLLTSIDLTPTGHELWISDASGGITHLDLRQDKSKARRYQLSDQKIGTVSINPVVNHFVLTASNSRVLRWVKSRSFSFEIFIISFDRVWDARKLAVIESVDPTDVEGEAVDNFLGSKEGQTCLRGEWRHGKSASSAYWDPRGRGIVSTSYDDKIRCKLSVSFSLYQALTNVQCGMSNPHCSRKIWLSPRLDQSKSLGITARQ